MFDQSMDRTRKMAEGVLSAQSELQKWQMSQIELAEKQRQHWMEAQKAQMEIGYNTWQVLGRTWLDMFTAAGETQEA